MCSNIVLTTGPLEDPRDLGMTQRPPPRRPDLGVPLEMSRDLSEGQPRLPQGQDLLSD